VNDEVDMVNFRKVQVSCGWTLKKTNLREPSAIVEAVGRVSTNGVVVGGRKGMGRD
jgi:hypothetical protein